MGAQESVARSKGDDMHIGEELSRKSGVYRTWTHVNPCTKNKKVKGTIFTKEYNGAAEEKKCIENGIKFLKQLRHPGVVSYLESSSSASSLSLMTERVQMLDLCIESLSPVEIHSGLRQILEVLVFLHGKANLSHNSLSPSTVFVTSSGEWKLAGFEFATSLAERPQSSFYQKSRSVAFTAPAALDKLGGGFRDAFAFGKLVQYAAGYLANEDFEDGVLDAMERHANLLVTATKPMDLSTLVADPAFENHLNTINDFLLAVHLKSDTEKVAFYQELTPRLRSLPPRVVAKRFCRLTLSRYVLLEPLSHRHLFPALMTPIESSPSTASSPGLLPLELYRSHIVPEIVRVFCVRETSVRLALLALFDLYAPYIPISQLDFVAHEVVLSSTDVDDRLVAASLRAMASLVPLLGASRVCTWKLSKHFVDGTPKPSSAPQSSRETTPKLRRPAAPLPPRARPSIQKDDEDEPPMRVLSKRSRDSEEEDEVGEMASMVNGHASHGQSTWNDEEDWTSDWEKRNDDEEEEEIAVKPTTTVRQQNGISPVVELPRKKHQVAEYEIPVVKLEEEDFFADMRPEIKTNGTIIDRLIKEKEKMNQHTSTTKPSVKFAMDDVTAAEDADWGDEDAWAAENEEAVEQCSEHGSSEGDKMGADEPTAVT